MISKKCRFIALWLYSTFLASGSAAVVKQVQLAARDDTEYDLRAHEAAVHQDIASGFLANVHEKPLKEDTRTGLVQKAQETSSKAIRVWEVEKCYTHIKKHPDDFTCPESCGFIRAEPTRLCQFKCVKASDCNSDNPLASFANRNTSRCEACHVPGCHRCGSESSNLCAECQEGFTLKNGRCLSLYRNYWNIAFATVGAIGIGVVYYIVAIFLRPQVNDQAVEKGCLFRELSATRDPYRDEKWHGRYKLSTNLEETEINGAGVMLHFRWQSMMMVWAIFGTLLFLIPGFLFWQRLGLLSVPNSRKSYEACEENVAYQTSEFNKMELIYFVATLILYIVTFVGSLIFAYRQRMTYQQMDRDNTTMKDFAIYLEGFKEMEGSLQVESIICHQLRHQKQFKDLDIVLVSVCWNFRGERAQIEELLDREIDAVDAEATCNDRPVDANHGDEQQNPIYMYRVDTALGFGGKSAEPELEEEERPEEVVLTFSPRPDGESEVIRTRLSTDLETCKWKMENGMSGDLNTGRVEEVQPKSEAAKAGVRAGWRLMDVNGNKVSMEVLDSCDAGPDDYSITFSTDKEFVKTFEPGKKTGLVMYDDTGIIDDVEQGSQAYHHQIDIGWKILKLNGQDYTGKSMLEKCMNSKSPYDMTFSKEVPRLLQSLRSSPSCYVVFQSEDQRNQALEELKKEPLKIGSQAISAREAICEPSTVVWNGFGSTQLKFYLSATAGCVVVFVAVILLDIFFYAPYVVYIFSYSDVPGMSQGNFLSNFLLSLLICVCNAMIYAIIGVITDKCSWTNGDSKDCFYCVKYTIAVFFNTLVDLATVLILAQGFSVDEAMKQQIAADSTMSSKAVAESPNMQRAIYEQLVAYIFPSCTLVPFLIEPIATTFAPFIVFKRIIGSRWEVKGPDAERWLQCPPFDLSRYGDIIVNMMLCCLTLVFTYHCLWLLFAYMIISLAVIYTWDKFRVLRYSTRTIFANNTMDNAVMYMMAMPCGVIVATLIFKAYGASHQGFLDDFKGQFRGEYGVRPDRYNIYGWLALGFFGHIVIHLLCLEFWVIPAAQRHIQDEDVRTGIRKQFLQLADNPEESTVSASVSFVSSAVSVKKSTKQRRVFDKMRGDKRAITEENFLAFLENNKVTWEDKFRMNANDIWNHFRCGHESVTYDELFAPDYDRVCKKEAANWLTTNPVFCLRSKYIYKYKTPVTFFRTGKENLIKKNEEINQYFEIPDKKVLEAKSYLSSHLSNTETLQEAREEEEEETKDDKEDESAFMRARKAARKVTRHVKAFAEEGVSAR